MLQDTVRGAPRIAEGRACKPDSRARWPKAVPVVASAPALKHVVVPRQVGADVAALSASLTKPLRPLWVSQQSRLWTDNVASAEDLLFTPLILVSASLPNARQRMSTGDHSTTLGPDNLIL